MSKNRVEWKVGLFALAGLVLLAGLLLAFSKGLSFYPNRYSIILRTTSVGGLKHGANVLMAGVGVGKVTGTTLSEDGKTARVVVDIYNKFQIHSNALFNIASMGFLGDAYVAITPGESKPGDTSDLLKNGDEVPCQEPFEMQKVARQMVGFITRIDTTAEKLNEAMGRLNNTLLSDESLSNATIAVSTFRQVSEHALAAVDGAHDLFSTNSVPVAEAITNLVNFSTRINLVADELDAVISTNRAEIGEVIHNFKSASATFSSLVAGADAGHGMVGTLLKDEKTRADFVALVDGWKTVGSNVSVLSGRINSNGIWSVLWKHKEPPPPKSKPSVAAKRDP
jgi:phospholipid/cholesterol/gamma-HCH transport system substrate-binding protein